MNCYVMIGGHSVRMGKSKADLVLAGATFLERVVGAASSAFDRVIAVQRPGGPPATRVETLFEHEHEGSGPVFGLARALEDADGQPFWVLAVDYPLVTAALLRELASQFVESDVDIALPVWDGRPQYLCAGYRPSIAPQLTDVLLEPNPSMRLLAESCSLLEIGERRIRETFGDSVLVNVNDDTAYAQLRRLHEEVR